MESIVMDDHDHEDDDQPTNSSDQEIDQDDHISTGRGGRSYECVFCKRGFTTAQALGGHMNIHRKDRAKNSNIRSSYNLSNNNKSSNYNKQDDDDDDHGCNTIPRFFQPVFASNPPTYLSTTPSNHHRHYFSSTSDDQQPILNYESNHQDHHHWRPHDYDHQVITSASREEERRRISLQFGWSNGEDDEDLERRIRSGDKEDELDLELRLGHDP